MSLIKKSIAIIGLILFILPAILILYYEISSPIGKSNPFVIVLIIQYAGIPAFVGLILFLLLNIKSRVKILATTTAIAIYLLLFSAIGKINSNKESLFLANHKDFLEEVSNDLLERRMVISDANEVLKKKNIPVSVISVTREGKHILFLFGGMLDNCYGIAFSLSDNAPSENPCGEITSWKKKEDNWFIWTTT